MRAYAADGHFKAGSMGPKVEACLRFVDAGGTAVIASLTEVVQAMAGEAGTRIVPDEAAEARQERAARRRRQDRSKAAGKAHAQEGRLQEGAAKKAGAPASAARPAPRDRHHHRAAASRAE